MAVYNSIDQYETEYDRLPAPTSAAKDKDWDTNSSSEENLISILKARDEDANLKAIDFLGDVRDAKQEYGRLRNGLVREGQPSPSLIHGVIPTASAWMAMGMAMLPIRKIRKSGWRRGFSFGPLGKTAIRRLGATM